MSFGQRFIKLPSIHSLFSTMFLHLALSLLLTSSCASNLTSGGSTGCGKPLPVAQSPPGGKSHEVQFKTSAGTDRTYLIHIPSNYDVKTPVPLIFSFHGHGKNSAQQELLSQFSNETSNYNPNGIAVYPQGTENSEGQVFIPLSNASLTRLIITRHNGKATPQHTMSMTSVSPRI